MIRDDRRPLGLLLSSALLLLTELVLIRFLGTEIPTVGFFKNLILIAAFLGMGVGLNSRRLPAREALAGSILSLMGPLALVLLVRHTSLAGSHFTGLPGEAVLLNKTSAADQIESMLLLCAAFAVSVLPHFFIGRLMAIGFDAVGERTTPLRAYGINIAGSLAGTILFTMLSMLSVNPRWWFGLCLALMIAMVWAEAPGLSRKIAAGLTALALAEIAAIALFPPGAKVYWTPYYKVMVSPWGIHNNAQTGELEQLGSILTVNNTWFHESFDVNQLGAPEESKEAADAARNLRYIAPFRYAKHDSVLVMGAGLGNDTAAALKYGAKSVTAVDIDAQIIKLSEEFHPNKPYDDPRSHIVIDDARHYLTATDRHYDLIVFGVLEARSLFSQFSNLRLDNYVYTREGLQTAYDRLTPDGTLWVNMWVPVPWVLDKFIGLMRDIVGDHFVVLHGIGSQHYSFVAGPHLDRDALIKDSTGVESVEVYQVDSDRKIAATVPSDDWPYVFFQNRTLPVVYMALLGMLVVMSVVPLRLAFPKLFEIQWGFFLFGAAFLLIEGNSVVRIALLAGTTWIVNSCVFAGMLIFIFLSNWAASRWKIERTGPLFIALIAALALSWALPMNVLLRLPNAAAIAIGAGVMTLPIFFSGCIFSSYFRNVLSPSQALGSNVFGAVLGGLAEYTSMLLGNRMMLGLTLLLYVMAWIAFSRAKQRG